jgi:hypothetical protein
MMTLAANYDRHEVASYLNCHYNTVHRLIQRGGLPVFRLPIRFPVSGGWTSNQGDFPGRARSSSESAARHQQGLTSAMLQTTLEKANGQLKSGKLDCLYAFTDGSATVGITDADSGEAVMEELEYPASPSVYFEKSRDIVHWAGACVTSHSPSSSSAPP